MKNTKIAVLAALLGASTFMSCTKTDVQETGSLNLNITGLEDLGSDYAYEGWIMVDGAPVSAGIFDVDANGNLSTNSFEIDKEQLEKATAYILTIEPSPDSDPIPSDVHILAGDFTNNSASLWVKHSAAIGSDLSTATGDYILATPTDGTNGTDENSGVWWLNNSSGSAVAGLSLPALPAGWEYEGWAVINGTPVSTGKFTSVSGADLAAPYSGTTAGPAFPGEDLLTNAPSGLNFPTDLAGQKVVISIEPSPDNSAAPFLLKPLVGEVPATATDHTVYNMANNAAGSNPTGTVTK